MKTGSDFETRARGVLAALGSAGLAISRDAMMAAIAARLGPLAGIGLHQMLESAEAKIDARARTASAGDAGSARAIPAGMAARSKGRKGRARANRRR